MGYSYNGVEIQEARTLSFEMFQERDPTGTDTLWMKYTIRVRGFINRPGLFTQDTKVTLNELKDRLETPRRAFRYTIGDEIIVTVGASGATAATAAADSFTLDAKMGPAPLPATVTEVTPGAFLIECGIVVCVVECADTSCFDGGALFGRFQSPVVSLRWTQSEAFDQNWVSTLTTSGKLIVRSDLLRSADRFRALCVPLIAPNYIRTSAKYTLSPDGTILDFDFVDQERDRLPPFPASSASGTFEITSRQFATRYMRATVRLEGIPGSNRDALMLRAVDMIHSKINAERVAAGGAGILPVPYKISSYMEDLFSPIVEVSIEAGPLALAPLVRLGRPFPLGSVGVLPAGVTRTTPGIAPPAFKRLAGLLVAMFRDPCACAAAPPDPGLPVAPPAAPLTPVIPTAAVAAVPAVITVGPVSAATATRLPLVRDSAPYDEYEILTEVTWNSGSVQMPGTGVGPDGGVSAVVQANGGMMKQVTSWVASRTGKPPQLPSFYNSDNNLYPLAGAIVTQTTEPSTDGFSLIHRTAGYYVHAVLDPSRHQIVPGTPPTFTDKVSDGALQANKYWVDLTPKPGATGTNPFSVGGSAQAVLNQPPQPPAGFGPTPLVLPPLFPPEASLTPPSGGGGPSA